jgi:DNA-binding MarR family transcriptional regulator
MSHSTAAALSRLLGPLRRAVLRATRAADGLPDLPDTHIEVLRTVVETPDISPKTIADQLGLARPTVSNLLQAMKREGLIALIRSEDDARVVHVTATDLASGLLSRYDAASEALLVAAMDELTPRDRAAVEAALPALSALQVILTAPQESSDAT